MNKMKIKIFAFLGLILTFSVALSSCDSLWDDLNALKTITISFDSNTGNGTMESQIFEPGVPQALNENKFTKDGYTFAGWATKADASEAEYADKANFTAAKDTTLYAIWNMIPSEPVLTKIEITTQPAKKEYLVGANALDLTGIKVTATYSDNSTKDVTSEVTATGFDSSKVSESQTITVSYNGKTATFTIKILTAELTTIKITTQPTKKEYFVGATALDLAEMVVTATYSDSTTKDITSEVTATGFDSSAAVDSQTITVTYNGKTDTFTVKILPVVLTKIEITTQPTKTVYFIGDEFDKTGMVVTATYNNGSTKDVTSEVTPTGFDSSAAVDSQTITVSYNGKTATFTIKILAVTKIEITTQPTKTTYFVGDEIDLTGMVVTATYSDNSTKDVASEVTATGFDSSAATDSQTITVTYNGKTDTFAVKIIAVVVTKIEITTQPKKTEYFMGDELDLTEMGVTATYNNGSTKDVTSEVTITGFDSSAAVDSQTITVTYDGKSDTFTVKINYKYLFHSKVTVLPAGINGTYGTSETYVEFGDWPQNVVPEADVEALGLEASTDKEMHGYLEFVKGTDNNYYVKSTENALNYNEYAPASNYSYLDGTSVKKDGTRWFKVMPIKWRVADSAYVVDGDAGSKTAKLLVAEDILTASIQYYEGQNTTERIIDGETIAPSNYMHSQIRAYLNGSTYTGYDSSISSNVERSQWQGIGFLQTAFETTAQESIITTKVDNSSKQMSYNGTNEIKAEYACPDTNDKIFLLSELEVMKYSDNATYNQACTKRVKKATDFAIANNAYQDQSLASKGGFWWLRSPSSYFITNARRLHFDGIARYDTQVYDTTSGIGIVPALCIDYEEPNN